MCWCAAPHVRELLLRGTVALAAPGHRRPTPSARRVPTGVRVRLEGDKAKGKGNSYAVGKCKGEGYGAGRRVKMLRWRRKAHLEKTALSATGSRR